MDRRNSLGADITLLLEGTYPYIRGGVSGWVHQIIGGLPEFTFALVFLGAKKADVGDLRYKLPENVISLKSHFLMDTKEIKPSAPKVLDEQCFADANKLHDFFREPAIGLDQSTHENVLGCLGKPGRIGIQEFLFSEEAWRFVSKRYERYASETSFSDFIWTVRSKHAALFKLADIAAQIEPSRAYHSVSTGYAGFLGALLNSRTGRPLILTEHGIYTKERKIDLQSAFMQENRQLWAIPSTTGMAYHHHLWIRFFEGIGRLIYTHADPIIALYDRNRQRQIRDGAAENRTRVIPNGIDLARFLPIRKQRPQAIPLILGLIGRVVPIKDIKTFIRTMRGVCGNIPKAEGWLIGPDDEDPEYARECRDLVTSLGLEGKVKFLGFQTIDEILPKLGLMVLTSISEAFPLVIVEAFASGLPVLTTDVGGCREIIEGSTPEDKALGSAGSVVPIANPEETAQAAIELLNNNQRWLDAQRAGIERVERYYTQSGVFDRYREIYQKAINC